MWKDNVVAQYRFATEAANYADYGGGAVLYSAPGRPGFPVRLASELFQRASAFRQSENGVSARPWVLYDPCCGGANLLTVLKLLHWEHIGPIIGSDIDPDALKIAACNFALLQPGGLRSRIDALDRLAAQFGKESHALHAAAARRLLGQMEPQDQAAPAVTTLAHADVLDAPALAQAIRTQAPAENAIDIVLCDLPYGETTRWDSKSEGTLSAVEPGLWASDRAATQLLHSVAGLLAPGAIVGLVARRGQLPRAAPQPYARVQRAGFGRREVIFWRFRPD